MPRAVMFPTCPRYVSSLPPSLSCSLFVTLAAFEFVWRRRHWPFDPNACGNGNSHCYSDAYRFANGHRNDECDGNAYANFDSASREDGPPTVARWTPNRKEFLANR